MRAEEFKIDPQKMLFSLLRRRTSRGCLATMWSDIALTKTIGCEPRSPAECGYTLLPGDQRSYRSPRGQLQGAPRRDASRSDLSRLSLENRVTPKTPPCSSGDCERRLRFRAQLACNGEGVRFQQVPWSSTCSTRDRTTLHLRQGYRLERGVLSPQRPRVDTHVCGVPREVHERLSWERTQNMVPDKVAYTSGEKKAEILGG